MDTNKVIRFMEILQQQLDEQRLNAPEFAGKMGYSRMTVNNWLNRKSVMSLKAYYKALEVLGIEEKLLIKAEIK